MGEGSVGVHRGAETMEPLRNGDPASTETFDQWCLGYLFCCDSCILNSVGISGMKFYRLIYRPFFLFRGIVVNQLTTDCQINAITFKEWGLCF